MNRFFAENLEAGQQALQPGEAHHATHVLRLAAGAQVELFDGRGRTAVGRIIEAKRGKVVVRIERANPPADRPRPVIHLAFAVPKGKRLDWLLEKATELAAASLQPVRFERSVAGGEPSGPKRQRWLGCCIAAAKQCGLNFLPELGQMLNLDQFLQEQAAGNVEPPKGRRRIVRLLGDLGRDAVCITEALKPADGGRQSEIPNPKSEIVLLVGPEGGLTAAERAACIKAGFRPVRLGRTTLRIETAAIALLAAATAACE